MEEALRINSLGQETSTEEPEVSEESGTSFMVCSPHGMPRG